MARILVIDDEDTIREVIRQMLEIEGFEVADAADGREGMALQRERPADLVITDLIMPDQEGLETIKELRNEFPKVKIIAISGGGWMDADSYLTLAERIGAHKALAKPFDRKSLVAAVRELLR